MKLDNVTVELRPRTEWEAADLGARMVRRDARSIYAVWFAITLPMLALALAMILFTPYGGWALFLYWWFEPLTDGPILHIISRRLFGESAGVKSSLAQTGRLALRNIIFLLPPYRLHFARSIAMPITQLEGLKGAARRNRAKVLNTRIMSFGTGVTAAYQHLVLSIYIGIILIVFALVPAEYQDSLGQSWVNLLWIETGVAAQVFQLLLMYIAQSALHPWFVGAGFGLYINCRTQLEAWDIEVAFRRMVQRRAAATAMLLLAVISLAALPVDSLAQDNEHDPGFSGYWASDETDTAIEAVLARDELRTYEEIERWQRKDANEPEPDEIELDSGSLGFFERIGRLFSFIVEFGLWILVGALLLLLYATRETWLPYLADIRQPAPERRRIILSTGEITAESLPDDIPAEVRRLWQQGQRRSALSLLFRASVFHAVDRYGVRLPSSATEGACVSAVSEQTGGSHAEYFRNVVTAWIWCAYGEREPAEESFLKLCTEWPDHYGEPA